MEAGRNVWVDGLTTDRLAATNVLSPRQAAAAAERWRVASGRLYRGEVAQRVEVERK